MNIRKNSKAPLALVLAVTAGIGLSACGASGSTDTSTAAATSSTVKTPTPSAVVRAIPGGTTAVALDSNFVAALGTLGLTPGTVGTATFADGSLTFPITGGTVTLYDKASGYRPWVQGVILHEGSGFSLTAGGTTVSLANFTVDPGKPARLFGDVSVNGKLAAPSAPLFNLNGKTLEPVTMAADGSAVLQGTRVELSEEAAGLLNQTFKTDALKANLLIGIATITAKTA